MRILLLNKFTSPDPAPTARLLGELGEGLQERGWEVIARSAGGSYRQGTGSGGMRRWMREAWAHIRLFVAGCLAPRPDVILCLSDPPGLVFTASLVSRIRRIPLAHWVMDVYPEIAAALGEVSPTSLPYRLLHSAVRSGYRYCGLIGCLDSDMADVLVLSTDPRMHFCPPWPPLALTASASPTHHPSPSPAAAFSWLYSGNLGRAHDFDTLLTAQKELERAGLAIDLVFQGRGPQLQAARNRAETLGLKRCRWLDYAADDVLISTLLQADVVIATQKPETRGLLWPSKLAVLKSLGRPLLWIGPLDGDIARLLREECPDAAVFSPGDAAGVAAWLQGRVAGRIALDPPLVDSGWREILAREQAHAVNAWHERLLHLAGPSCPDS